MGAQKLFKEHKPTEIAEFSQSHDIYDKPDLFWWVPYTLIKIYHTIAAVTALVCRTTHKYGIEVPTSVDHAKRIDASNGNRLQKYAINKEMTNVEVTFEIPDEGKPAPVGWKKASGNLVFDVNLDFTCKARWVKDSNRTADPEHSTFYGFV